MKNKAREGKGRNYIIVGAVYGEVKASSNNINIQEKKCNSNNDPVSNISSSTQKKMVFDKDIPVCRVDEVVMPHQTSGFCSSHTETSFRIQVTFITTQLGTHRNENCFRFILPIAFAIA